MRLTPSPTVSFPRSACVLSLALALAACATGEDLAFRPPTSVSPAPAESDLAPEAAAATIRAAGFDDVALRDGGRTVRVRTSAPALVDCGEIVQTFMGETSSFPGTAGRAALLASAPGDVILRGIEVASVADLTLRPEGGYVVAERHEVRLSYRRASDGAVWREAQVFDRDGGVRFADGTSCRASGQLAQIIG